MLNIYIAETIGTFVFLIIILTNDSPVMIAVALLVGILIATIASQGHLNPAVSIMEYMNGKIDNNELCGYISAQLVGVILALTWYKYGKNKKTLSYINNK